MLRIALLTSAMLLGASLAQAQTTFYPDGSATDQAGNYWTPNGTVVPGYRAYDPGPFDGHSAIGDPSGPYSTGPSLPPLDDDAYGLPPRGMGPPEPPPAYRDR
jgi:hypothetical protein